LKIAAPTQRGSADDRAMKAGDILHRYREMIAADQGPPVQLRSTLTKKNLASMRQFIHDDQVNLVRFGLVICSFGSAEPGFRFHSTLDSTRGIRAATPHDQRNTIMHTGTVKWFNATKGYGFIQPDDGSPDVFLHISDVQRSGMQDVREGDKLEFEVQQGQQGKMSACNLRAA
jgi:CspA family cold shock protein